MITSSLQMMLAARALLLTGQRDALWNVWPEHPDFHNATLFETIGRHVQLKHSTESIYRLQDMTCERELELYDEAILRMQQDTL